MANRGRGRGKASMSISNEQLGFGKFEALPPPVLQPPPKYPHLDNKPMSFELNTEMSYLLEIKRDLAEYLKESSYNVQSVVIKKDIERYSDRYQDMVSDKIGYEHRFDWQRLPSELKPIARKRKIQKSQETKVPTTKKKKKKDVDIDKKLKELEQKESTQQSDVEEEDKDDEEDEDKDADDPVEEEEEEIDEEMDDGTDYVNNYFDNGEGYEDEDDNLDDGPVY